jgi:hypothetical protein
MMNRDDYNAYRLHSTLLTIAAAVTVYSILAYDTMPLLLRAVVALLLAASAYIWIARFRCPHCRKRLGTVKNWFAGCPKTCSYCGHELYPEKIK